MFKLRPAGQTRPAKAFYPAGGDPFYPARGALFTIAKQIYSTKSIICDTDRGGGGGGDRFLETT